MPMFCSCAHFGRVYNCPYPLRIARRDDYLEKYLRNRCSICPLKCACVPFLCQREETLLVWSHTPHINICSSCFLPRNTTQTHPDDNYCVCVCHFCMHPSVPWPPTA